MLKALTWSLCLCMKSHWGLVDANSLVFIVFLSQNRSLYRTTSSSHLSVVHLHITGKGFSFEDIIVNNLDRKDRSEKSHQNGGVKATKNRQTGLRCHPSNSFKMDSTLLPKHFFCLFVLTSHTLKHDPKHLVCWSER